MANDKKKVTEDTKVYIGDIAGKIFEQHTRLQTEVFSKLGLEQQR